MEEAALIATILCRKGITAEDMFKCLMALKLSRIAHNIGYDSLTDLCGYVEGLWNYKLEEDAKEVIKNRVGIDAV